MNTQFVQINDHLTDDILFFQNYQEAADEILRWYTLDNALTPEIETTINELYQGIIKPKELYRVLEISIEVTEGE